MILISRFPLEQELIEQVKDILKTSQCPHETLINSLERYSGICDGKIFFDMAQNELNSLSMSDINEWLNTVGKNPQLHIVVI